MKQSDEEDSFSDGDAIQIRIVNQDVNNNHNEIDTGQVLGMQRRRPSIFEYLNEFESESNASLLQFKKSTKKSAQMPMLRVSYSSDELLGNLKNKMPQYMKYTYLRCRNWSKEEGEACGL